MTPFFFTRSYSNQRSGTATQNNGYSQDEIQSITVCVHDRWSARSSVSTNRNINQYYFSNSFYRKLSPIEFQIDPSGHLFCSMAYCSDDEEGTR